MPDFINPIDQPLPDYCDRCGADYSEDCGCEDDYEEAERLDREEEERTCIGPLCINPHYSHSRSECETEETVKAFYEEMEADRG